MFSYEKEIDKAAIQMMEIIKSDTKLLNWFINYTPSGGYMFNDNPNVIHISNLVEEAGARHSGASFGICMQICKKRLTEEKENKQ